MGAVPRVKEARAERGLSQLALAAAARLTRQSLGAIEAGRAIPGVDVALRIARALDRRVEELFDPAEVVPTLDVELAGAPATPRIALARVRGRWVGLPLGGDGLRTAADALIVTGRGRRADVTPLRPLAEPRGNLVVMGCATGLGLLADRLRARGAAGRCLWLPSSSGAALRALARGHTHVAGVHGTADASKDTNIETARRAAGREALALVTLARWEAGLLARSDDVRVRSVTDLTARGVRLVVRERGAGARQLLEQRLRAAGADPAILRSAPLVAAGHLDVARAVAMGAADTGVATRDAALAFGLRFVPLAEERYDLVIPRPLMCDARVERLLDVLASRAGRRELESLGYDVSAAGRRVAEVRSA